MRSRSRGTRGRRGRGARGRRMGLRRGRGVRRGQGRRPTRDSQVPPTILDLFSFRSPPLLPDAFVTILSDLHLEWPGAQNCLFPSHPYNRFIRLATHPTFVSSPPLDRILLLCGDIADISSPDFLEFLRLKSRLYERVFIIGGNHEFFEHEYFRAKRRLEYVSSQFDNVEFLDRRVATCGANSRTRIVGCTLWSQHDPSDTRVMRECLDYYRIAYVSENEEVGEVEGAVEPSDPLYARLTSPKLNEERTWANPDPNHLTCEIRNSLHEIEKDFLRESLESLRTEKKENEDELRVIVATHHDPDFDILEEFNDVITVWCHGHSHQSRVFERSGVFVVSNQAGYFANSRAPQETCFRERWGFVV